MFASSFSSPLLADAEDSIDDRARPHKRRRADETPVMSAAVHPFPPPLPLPLPLPPIAVARATHESADTADMDSALDAAIGRVSVSAARKRGRPTGSVAAKLPPELERRMGDANTAFIAEDYDRAIAILTRIIQAAPVAPAPYHTLALVYEAQGQWSSVLDTLRLLASLQPKDAGVWRRIAHLSLDSGDLDAALDTATRAARLEPDDADSVAIKATVLKKKGEFAKAAASYAWLVKHGRNTTAILADWADCLTRTGSEEQAMSVLEDVFQRWKAKEANQENTSTNSRILASPPLRFDAFDDLSWVDLDAPAEDPTAELQAFALLASLYVSLHRYDRVLTLYESVKHSPLSPLDLPLDFQVHFAIALIHSGLHTRAAILLNHLWDEDLADSAELIWKVGEAYINTGHLQSALNAYNLIQHHEPFQSSAQLWLRQAQCLRELGTSDAETHECLQLYERVLEVDQGNAEARVGRIECRRELGLIPPLSQPHLEEPHSPTVETALLSTATKTKRRRRRAEADEVPPLEAGTPICGPVSARVIAPFVESLLDPFTQVFDDFQDAMEHAHSLIEERDYDTIVTASLPLLNFVIAVASGYLEHPAIPVTLTIIHPKKARSTASHSLLTARTLDFASQCLLALDATDRAIEGVDLAQRLDQFLARKSSYSVSVTDTLTDWERARHRRLNVMAAKLAVRANDIASASHYMKLSLIHNADNDEFLLLCRTILDALSMASLPQCRKWLHYCKLKVPNNLAVVIAEGFIVARAQCYYQAVAFHQRAITHLAHTPPRSSVTAEAARLRLLSVLCLSVSLNLVKRARSKSHRLSQSQRAIQPAQLVKSLHYVAQCQHWHGLLEQTIGSVPGEGELQRAQWCISGAVRHRALEHLQRALLQLTGRPVIATLPQPHPLWLSDLINVSARIVAVRAKLAELKKPKPAKVVRPKSKATGTMPKRRRRTRAELIEVQKQAEAVARVPVTGTEPVEGWEDAASPHLQLQPASEAE